ncbi:NPC intracellular cholesterol transporter 2-like [Mya arenaria]|uniref:NPC intracellular cholesterol transporter 2-like n=1 Tax=Mya arenaria TaxID=6604 RepID=UPI0022E5862F|nr:NPC intracellular cholesterol transporter 2-like [Mya arenaria]
MASFHAYVFLSFMWTISALVLHRPQSCGESFGLGGYLRSIDLVPCDKEPCAVYSGHTYNATISFTAHISSLLVTETFDAKLGDFPVWEVFPIIPPNPCVRGLQCPILAGTTYTYTASVTTPTDATEILNVTGRLRLRDDRGDKILCYEFPLMLNDPARDPKTIIG